MNAIHISRRKNLLSFAAACSVLLAAGSPAAGQQLDYGTRQEAGETWAYIQVDQGQELIAAPLLKPENGYLDLGDGLGAHPDSGPVLSISGSFQAGSENKYVLNGAAPKSDALILIGFELAYDDFYGIPVVPQVSLKIPLETGPAGSASFTFKLPNDWDPDSNLYAQALVKDKASPDGTVLSNVIRANGRIAGRLVEDASRIRVLGFELEDLEEDTESVSNCVNDEIQAYIDLLNSPIGLQGAYLWQEGPMSFDGTEEEWETISRLSQNLMFLAKKAEPFQVGGWTANGCTSSPDFDFGHCCDAHDHCYCIGGECPCEGGLFDDRKECDLDLRDCIRRAGHPWLAGVYYRGVRWFGQSHFNCW